MKDDEFRDNADPVAAGPGVIGTRAQAKGSFAGGALFGVVGLLAGLGLGLIPLAGLAIGIRLLIGGLVGLAAGATAGFVVGGGYGPQIAGETDAHGSDPEFADRARRR